ncbi:unnamed protein product, partial [marine sediment metagenome]
MGSVIALTSIISYLIGTRYIANPEMVALIILVITTVLFTIGGIIGYFITEIFCKKLIKSGKVRMVIFNLKGWEIHLHHWVLASLAILTAYLFNFIYSVPIIFVGILGG